MLPGVLRDGVQLHVLYWEVHRENSGRKKFLRAFPDSVLIRATAKKRISSSPRTYSKKPSTKTDLVAASVVAMSQKLGGLLLFGNEGNA